MRPETVIACVVFASAIALETIIWMTFLRGLRLRHPQQWAHAAQPTHWHGRTALSARSTMLYLLSREYLDSTDDAGGRYCARHRSLMLMAYWCTVGAGIAAIVALAVEG